MTRSASCRACAFRSHHRRQRVGGSSPPLTLDTFAVNHTVGERTCARAARPISRAWYRALARRRLRTAASRGRPRHRHGRRRVEQAIAAAVLAAGTDAMASHRSAAHVWGCLDRRTMSWTSSFPRRSRHLELAGVECTAQRQGDLRPMLRAGIRTCNILRMLCDLGAVDPSAVHGAVGHVVTNALASPQALWSDDRRPRSQRASAACRHCVRRSTTGRATSQLVRQRSSSAACVGSCGSTTPSRSSSTRSSRATRSTSGSLTGTAGAACECDGWKECPRQASATAADRDRRATRARGRRLRRDPVP